MASKSGRKCELKWEGSKAKTPEGVFNLHYSKATSSSPAGYYWSFESRAKRGLILPDPPVRCESDSLAMDHAQGWYRQRFASVQKAKSTRVTPRWMHRVWAMITFNFWVPCPFCRRWFGYHEWHGKNISVLRDNQYEPRHVCPNCHQRAEQYNRGFSLRK